MSKCRKGPASLEINSPEWDEAMAKIEQEKRDRERQELEDRTPPPVAPSPGGKTHGMR